MRVATAEEMREIDRKTIQDFGTPSLELMERAGSIVADVVMRMYRGRSITVIAGGGNNGGDGLVTARLLKKAGIDAKAFLVSDEESLSPDCRFQYRAALENGIRVEIRKHISAGDIQDSVVIDALFGTGLNKPVSGPFLDIIKTVNERGSPVVSIDVPSGISADNGQVLGQAIRADLTVSFGLPKIGHLLHPGAEYAGKLIVENIGFPDELLNDPSLKHHLIERLTVRSLIPKRKPDSHKGVYGHVMVLAGSAGKTGAAFLASRACMRAGAGAVTIGVPDVLFPIFQTRVLEEMTIPLQSHESGTFSMHASQKALDFIHAKADTVLIGPGIGVSDDVIQFVKEIVIHAGKPLLIDADALNCIAVDPDILRKTSSEVVITPHPNEMKRLLGRQYPDITGQEVNRRRIEIARSFAAEKKVICVLKGAPTVVASPDGSAYINSSGNPGMATAGAGDVLSGVISAFLAQGMSALNAAICGVYLHGLAGDIARDELGEYSLIAGDLIRHLPGAFRFLHTLG
ncbi:MAG: NAD(P)H-hydrate dehydratase [bacterium]